MTTIHDQYLAECAYESLDIDIQQLLSLAVGIGAQHVLELGTRSGSSTCAWLAALEQTGGKLTTVDLAEAPRLKHDGIDWVHLVGNDMSAEVMRDIRARGDYDLLFIDTSHHYQHTVDELRTYAAHATGLKLVVCHDYELESPFAKPESDPPFPVKVAVDEFAAQYGLDVIHFPGLNGLAAIKVGL